MGSNDGRSEPTLRYEQLPALYRLSSFFNQLPVAGEIFPTNVRATNHGIAAAMGKLGAIVASLWISYITDSRVIFLISALFGLAGVVGTVIFLPDTTNLTGGIANIEWMPR